MVEHKGNTASAIDPVYPGNLSLHYPPKGWAGTLRKIEEKEIYLVRKKTAFPSFLEQHSVLLQACSLLIAELTSHPDIRMHSYI